MNIISGLKQYFFGPKEHTSDESTEGGPKGIDPDALSLMSFPEFEHEIEVLSARDNFQTEEGCIHLLNLCTSFTDKNSCLKSCSLLQKQIKKVSGYEGKLGAHLVLMKCFFAHKMVFEAEQQYNNLIDIIRSHRRKINLNSNDKKVIAVLNIQRKILEVTHEIYQIGLKFV